MKTVTELMRKHLLEISPKLDSNSYEALKISEWSSEFETLMRNRLIMGALRYNRLKTPRPEGHTIKMIDMISARLLKYNLTGNKEMLIDVANLCLVEFIHSDHPKAHFVAVDRTERKN